jgi:hypothetical protein
MMLSHHGALDNLKLFHLEDGGFNHQRDYKAGQYEVTEGCFIGHGSDLMVKKV